MDGRLKDKKDATEDGASSISKQRYYDPKAIVGEYIHKSNMNRASTTELITGLRLLAKFAEDVAVILEKKANEPHRT